MAVTKARRLPPSLLPATGAPLLVDPLSQGKPLTLVRCAHRLSPRPAGDVSTETSWPSRPKGDEVSFYSLGRNYTELHLDHHDLCVLHHAYSTFDRGACRRPHIAEPALGVPHPAAYPGFASAAYTFPWSCDDSCCTRSLRIPANTHSYRWLLDSIG
jgi:hypothetical protein